MTEWTLYLIRTSYGNLYTGITTDIARRFAEQQANSKKTARYLRGRGPLELVFSQEVGDRSAALKAEAAVKKLSKPAKEKLLTGDINLEELIN